jgi:hypothetical protein
VVNVETPANPTLDIADIADIAEVAAQADGVPVLIDNTFATAVLHNPAGLGATLVPHSAMNYLGGHGDVVGGVVACADEATAAELRRLRAIPVHCCIRWVPTCCTGDRRRCLCGCGASRSPRSRYLPGWPATGRVVPGPGR